MNTHIGCSYLIMQIEAFERQLQNMKCAFEALMTLNCGKLI